MSDKEQVIKHLEMIQNIITRLAHNSFLIKGWSMTILIAAMLLITKNVDHSQYIVLSFLIPIIFFGILDSYFLCNERQFRGLFNDVRKQDKTDFAMDISAQKNKPGCKWHHSFFSITLIIFYLVEISFIVIIYLILSKQ